ncbi:MAG: ribosomal protein S18-alanine N-acetyltransferase [Clostridia bacterium]|nr:ribosomal protein S18-alanine N-acetyltransferase [Clostridia bacterium]
MGFNVIPMDSSHVDKVCELEKSSFSSPWSRDDLEYQLDNAGSHFLVAVDTEKKTVAGYIGVQEISGEAYITNIAVFKKFRRHGAGSLLLNTASDDAFARGCEFITLEVRESNLPAIELYEKSGFERMGIRKNFYSNPEENAIIYTLFNRNRKD